MQYLENTVYLFSFVVYKSLRMEKCVANDTRIDPKGSSFEFLEKG